MPTKGAVIPPQLLLDGTALYANQGSVYELDAAGGALQQRYPASGWIFFASFGDALYLSVNRHPNHRVQALSKKDGSVLWDYEVEDQLPQAPAVVDNAVYVGTTRGYIYAFGAEDGTLLWRASIASEDNIRLIVRTSPTVFKQILFLAPTVNPPLKPSLFAFHTKDGKLLWQAPLPGTSSFPCVVTQEMLYLSTNHGYVALDPKAGLVLWQREMESVLHMASPPVISNGNVYLSASEWRHIFPSSRAEESKLEIQTSIYALRADDGTLLWQRSVDGSSSTSLPTTVSIIDKTLFVGANNGVLFAYRCDDGMLLWSYQTGGSSISTPVGNREIVYVGANDGYVYALRADDGTFLWRTFVSTSLTVVVSSSVSQRRI